MRAVAGLWVGCGELVGASAPDDTRGRADGADDAVVDALSEISQRIGLFASEVIRGALSVVKSVRTNVSRETFALYQVIRACAARFCAALRRTACRAVRHAEDGPTDGATRGGEPTDGATRGASRQWYDTGKVGCRLVRLAGGLR